MNRGRRKSEGNMGELSAHVSVRPSPNTNIPDGADHIYTNDAGTGPVATIYGADSSGTYGNEINGEGNATYIYAGNGDNTVLLGDISYKATAPLATPISAVLQGGSGNQSLIGVGNGAETITGGAVGSDTSASTYIDGGGATAMLVGGGQTSVIFGGTGADMLVASSADGSSPPGFNPTSIEIAGLSFWGDVYSTQLDENNNSYQETALPTVSWVGTSSDDVQINLSLFQSDGTFAAPIGLLGSSLDSGTDQGQAALRGERIDWRHGFRLAGRQLRQRHLSAVASAWHTPRAPSTPMWWQTHTNRCRNLPTTDEGAGLQTPLAPTI